MTNVDVKKKEETPIKLSKFAKLLDKKVKEWEDNPFTFSEESLKFLKKNCGKHIEALEGLFQISVQLNNPFEANEGILKYIREHKEIEKILFLYYNLYANFSDTQEETLWMASFLNEIKDDDVNLLKHIISIHNQMDNKEKSIELYLKTKEKFPEHFSELEETIAFMYSEIPEYIEKGKELVKKIDITVMNPESAIQIGSLKFYSGINKDGLIYHFGGEDFRPDNFLSKKPIPNSKTHDFNGKSVVITPYRGMGDSMILSRFISKFKNKWPEVKLYIATEKSMIPLYKEMKDIHAVGTEESYAGKSFDHCLGVNMLARYLKEQLVDENGKIPYHEWVSYPNSYDEKWKKIINKDNNKPLIGINWKGSQRLGGAPTLDGKNTSRDLELREFIYIVDMYPNYNFVVTNNDVSEEENKILSLRSNVLVTKELKDFGDTAALINLCDVIVSVDTSVSTLSASLSKNTIVLAKFWPDYRWLYHELWWNTNENFKVEVHRKEKYNDGWSIPISKTILSLRDYSKDTPR